MDEDQKKFMITFRNLYFTLKGDYYGVLRAWRELGVHINYNVAEHSVLWFITGYLIGRDQLN